MGAAGPEAAEEEDQDHAAGEPDDVGQVGDAGALGGGRALEVEPLENEPGAEHDPGRQPHRDEEQERHQAGHPGPGEQDQVGAEHPGDGPRRPDQGVFAARVRQGEPVGRQVPAGQVEDQVADAAEPVLDVVAEHEQEQHVAGQVQQPAVEEHGREHRQGRDLLVVGPDADAALGGGRAGGHVQRVVLEQLHRDGRPLPEEGELAAEPVRGVGVAADVDRRDRRDEEDDHVDGDQRPVDDRRPPGGVVVVDRDEPEHLTPRGGCAAAAGRRCWRPP